MLRPVVVLAPHYPPAFRGGGPIRTLEALVRTAPPCYDVRVVTRHDDQGDPTPLAVEVDTWTERDGAAVRYTAVKKLRSFAAAMASVRASRAELLYVNSFFNVWLSILPQMLRRLSYIPSGRLLVAPRGEFGAAAISSKSWKKKGFVRFYRFLRLHRDVIWHASSLAEQADIERIWGSAAHVIVRENDTLLPDVSHRGGLDAQAQRRTLSLVSVGRLVEHKGLHLAIAGLLKAQGPVELDVYGPAEDVTYAASCRALVTQLPEHVAVRFHEALAHEKVRATVARYDALIMPTAGENFGHVIAEALSVCCPVICSDTTPWSSVLAEGGGVVVPDRTSESWADALGDYAALPPADRVARREQAGAAYDRWKAQTASPHIFDLVLAPTPDA